MRLPILYRDGTQLDTRTIEVDDAATLLQLKDAIKAELGFKVRLGHSEDNVLPEDQPNSELANVHFQDGRMLFAQKAESPVAKPPEGPGVGPANQPVVHPSDQVAAVPAPSVLKRPLGEVDAAGAADAVAAKRSHVEQENKGTGASGTFRGAESVAQILICKFKTCYDSTVGSRLLQQLLHSGETAPVDPIPTAMMLGRLFPLAAYQPPVKFLGETLLNMEAAKRTLFDIKDDYFRTVHVIRSPATPGLGSSAASVALWSALHHHCQAPGFLGTCAHIDVHKLMSRVNNSLSPQRMLVFKLNFKTDGVGELDALEKDLDMGNILALRMLYAALDHEKRQGFHIFLQEMETEHPGLLKWLVPAHVEAFVRVCAGFSAADPLLMVWVFDEADAMTAKVDGISALSKLLLKFVLFRLRCRADTMPVLVVTHSDAADSISILQTASAKARIADLPQVVAAE